MPCLAAVAGVVVGEALQLLEEEAERLGAAVAERHARRRLLRLAADPAARAQGVLTRRGGLKPY